jgi:hypothetical protein
MIWNHFLNTRTKIILSLIVPVFLMEGICIWTLRSADNLKTGVAEITIFAILIVSGAGFYLLRSIVRPIQELAAEAGRLGKRDLMRY